MKTAAFAVGLFAACAVHGAETVRIAPDAHDAGPAFVAALERVRAGGVIELAPGEYHLRAASAPQKRFFISNHDQSDEHRVPLPFDGVTNVTLRGHGARLVFHGECIGVLVRDAVNVRLEDLRLDWARSAMTEARVTGFAPGETHIAIDHERYPCALRGGKLVMLDEGGERPFRYLRIFDGKTHEMIAESSDIVYDGEARDLGGGAWALRHNFSGVGAGVREGDVIAFRPPLRNCPACVVYRAKDTVLEDVAIHDALGMGVICQRSENFTWRGSRTAADATAGVFPAEGRYSSTHADASHFSNVKGRVLVENCLFQGMMDDAINVHSTCLSVTNVLAPNVIRCRYMHAQAVGFETFLPGERLRFINNRTLENGWGQERTVTAVKRHDEREITLTLDRPLPQGFGKGDAVENADYQCAATFRCNILRFNRARGTLFTTPHPVLVESNLFDTVTGSPILFAGDAFYWYESGACRDVTVRGNVFSNCCTAATRLGFSRGILSFYPMVRDLPGQKARYHGNVLVEGNEFHTFDVPLLFAISVENLVWRDNKVLRNDDYRSWGQAPFILRHCRNVTVDGKELPENCGEGAMLGRTVEPFDDGWRFSLDGGPWRDVRLPHDWAIESAFSKDFDAYAGRLPYSGRGIYRKKFVLPPESARQAVFLEIDGAMCNSTVRLNGRTLGGRPYGYMSFCVQLTAELKRPGEENVLEVEVNTPPASARFYTGAGLYRHIRLVRTHPVHIAYNGVFVRTEDVKEGAKVVANVEFEGEMRGVTVAGRVMKDGREVATCSASWPHRLTATLKNPVRWSPETPALYTLAVDLLRNGTVVDSREVQFGVRTIRFDPKKGFFLNGKRRQMKGVCLHHDLGALGAAFNARAFERQLELLKAMGCDAIRTSHNPPDPAVPAICDRMGFLVMDEAFDFWEKGKRPNDYHLHWDRWHRRDLQDFVRRDRSHPSIVMWSTGNEIPGSMEMDATDAVRTGRELMRTVRNLDAWRPTVAGHFRSTCMSNGIETVTDVFGANYRPWDYGWYIEHNPGGGGIVGSETCSMVSSRGEYMFPLTEGFSRAPCSFVKSGFADGQVTSYDCSPLRRNNYPPDLEFMHQERNPACYGEFVWTGFDYIGEPDPFADVARSSYYGILDLCGFPKDRYYAYQAHWRPDLPMAHLLPHWTWPGREGQRTPVVCYTSGDEAELLVNGRSQGRQRREPFVYKFVWKDVAYEPGEIMVKTWKSGKAWATDCVRTAGAPDRVEARVDRDVIAADGEDLSFVTMRILDKDGNFVPRAAVRLDFDAVGAVELAGVCNGDATDYESLKGRTLRTFNGMCLAILRGRPGAKGFGTLRIVPADGKITPAVAYVECR